MNVTGGTIETLHHAAGRDIPDCLLRFYKAFLSRDEQLLDSVLDDGIDWLLAGPADQFDHYGARHGKAEVIELITRIMPCYYRTTGFALEHLVVEGDGQDRNVATRVRMRAHQRDTGRVLSLRSAQFLRFANGKLTSFRGVPDTFDAVEQLVGHPVDVAREMTAVPDDLIADDGGEAPRES